MYARYFEPAITARRPMIPSTITISMSVKPQIRRAERVEQESDPMILREAAIFVQTASTLDP
jgi:hypothetical protein